MVQGPDASNEETAVDLVTAEVSHAEKTLRRNTAFNRYDRYAWQALELSKFTTESSRRYFLTRFYECESVNIRTGEKIEPPAGEQPWTFVSENLGFWFQLRHSGKLYEAKGRRDLMVSEPARLHFWAILGVASATVQGIRSLSPIARQAFSASGEIPIDVDEQLSSIATHLMDASDLRIEIGDMPAAATPEGAHAAEVWTTQVGDFQKYVLEPILRRIGALFVYRNHLESVRVQTALVHRLNSSSHIDNKLEELAQRAGRDSLDEERITSASADLHQAEIARAEALAEVRGDYLNVLR